MSHYVDALLRKAFHSIPAQEYNRYREAGLDSPDAQPLFYEVPLVEGQPWTLLRDQVYPAYSRFLNYKDFDSESGKGTVVALFFGARCHLIKGDDFLAAFREVEGLSPPAFHLRVLQWLSEG
jgi:hypothetical protein